MATALPFLDHIRIERFRLFDSFVMEGLSQVNLLLGQNSVGKTTVLEALYLFGSDGSTDVCDEILRSRDESAASREERGPSIDRPREGALSDAIGLLNFFHKRPDWRVGEPSFALHTNRGSLIFEVKLFRMIRDEQRFRLEPLQPMLFDEADPDQSPVLQIRGKGKRDIPLERPYRRFWPVRDDDSGPECAVQFVRPGSLTNNELGRMWERITLTDYEEDVYDAVRLLEPRLDKLSFVRRTPMVRLRGEPRPVPLRSLGDGVNRILALAVALATSRGGLLLIDEFENGLHYSVQEKVWSFLMEGALRFHTQIFATSHSLDCLRSYTRASRDNLQVEGVAIRLEQRKRGIGAVRFSEEELEAVTSESIEIR